MSDKTEWQKTAHDNAMQVLADRNAELMERIKELTAAAEVDSSNTRKIIYWLKRNATAENNPEKKAAFVEAHNAALKITAAAEVGEPLPSTNWKEGKPYNYCPECGRDDRFLDAATIERCAQVAEEPKDIYGIGSEIAAAIRALKDK